MEGFIYYTIGEISADVKTASVGVLTYIVSQFVDNPIGTAASLIGMLYMFERWRTQRVLRKKAEKDFNKEK